MADEHLIVALHHLSTSGFTGSVQWLWSVFNTRFAGSKSVYALAGQCLLARHAQRNLIVPFFSICLVWYPDISVKYTLVMDVLVTDILVTGNFGNRTFRLTGHFGNWTFR